MKQLKIIGLVLGLGVFLATASIGLASSGNKYGKAGTPPFPQPAEEHLQKVVFIRYAPGKEPVCNEDGICDKGENWKKCPLDCEKPGNGEEPTPTPTPEESACYGFLTGSKPRWNWLEGYEYAEANLGNVSDWATRVWNDATSATIFGEGSQGDYLWGEYDYVNSISYGDYPNSNVIAVTAIWFRGKNIYEYDIMFDTDYFPSSVDLDTVALHEFGHGAGMDDLYNAECIDEVMYGIYEGVKRELQSGDIAGIQALYGE